MSRPGLRGGTASGVETRSFAAAGDRGLPLPSPSRVLFLCTGNGSRSQLAEALLEHISDGRIEVVSAGSHPSRSTRTRCASCSERGIDISAHRSKHLDEFIRRRFDFVITLCDRVREVCPEFPGMPNLVHWSIPDPALEGDDDDVALSRRSNAPPTSSRRASDSCSPSSTTHPEGGIRHMP